VLEHGFGVRVGDEERDVVALWNATKDEKTGGWRRERTVSSTISLPFFGELPPFSFASPFLFPSLPSMKAHHSRVSASSSR